MSDLVSVIMPSYNTGRFIAESIKSVLLQTYSNLELIIVDDCSTDNTDEVVSGFNDSRIKYIKNDHNSGAAISRNKAIKMAKGRWIAFLDSDDLWTADKLEKQISFMEKHSYAFSYTNYEKIDEKSSPLNICCTGPKIITKRKMYHYCYPGCLTVIYDSQKVGLVQIEDIKKNNDYAMWLVVSKKEKCYLLDETLSFYRIRKKSISHDSVLKKIRSHYDLFHVCDKRTPVVSFFLASFNMFYGLLKKLRYEKSIVRKDA